jgi:lysine 6-dehydrogenase
LHTPRSHRRRAAGARSPRRTWWRGEPVKVLLLGATGAHGRRAAAELARSDEVTQLTVAGRHHEDVGRLAQTLGGRGGKVAPEVIDLDERGTARRPTADADVIASCVGPGHYEAACVEEAIRRRTPYVSLCNDQTATDQVLSLDGAARNAGVSIVSGCGFSPGITNLLVGLAAAELDEVDEVEIDVASSAVDAPGNATMSTFLRDLNGDAGFVSDHVRVHERAGTSPKLVYFPEPVGWVETFRSGHPEVHTLLRRWPDLRSLQFRIGLTERAAMDAARASKSLGLTRSEGGRHGWLKLARAMRPVLAALPPRGPSWTAARVDVWGTSGGGVTTISVGVVDHLANLACVPLAHAATELGSGRVRKEGVHSPDEVFEPKRFLNALTRRGLRMARLDPEPV